MGIDNRDYVRDSHATSLGGPGFYLPPVCRWLLIVNVVVFFAQILLTQPPESPRIGLPPGVTDVDGEFVGLWMPMVPQVSLVQQWLALDSAKVAKGQVWRLLTYAFCHDRFVPWHIVANMALLIWLGTRLEHFLGSTEFCLFYCAAAIAAAAAFLAFNLWTGRTNPAIGASGAVWGIIVVYAISHPNDSIEMFGMFPFPIRHLALFYLALDMYPVALSLFGYRSLDTGIAHAAHVGGAAFGFLYFKRQWRLAPSWNKVVRYVDAHRRKAKSLSNQESLRNKKSLSNESAAMLKLHRPAERSASTPTSPAVDQDLDRVLQKIQNQGSESLTDDEREVLRHASDRFRTRQSPSG
ncbi:rhomboid family intramembrane serine protease [Roseiconus nitratireducens]|uniref:Rhomboid family intramembrane serine protease n=1 Tax=Roseiconus nitratireducens TaxID=2605748 RepID=A0A5M6DI55_9BACT|nr:rhomboid family intramembrane serine protease [Roseiconus nitratireducens]KAA5547143.1 rhomboid family intramembrane serine protease [Roseiconus nitratireducens]